jgi:hypothetical protein
VVDVAPHRGEHDEALAALVGLLHVRLEVDDGDLHPLGLLRTIIVVVGTVVAIRLFMA